MGGLAEWKDLGSLLYQTEAKMALTSNLFQTKQQFLKTGISTQFPIRNLLSNSLLQHKFFLGVLVPMWNIKICQMEKIGRI